jgi:hypothetical protein
MGSYKNAAAFVLLILYLVYICMYSIHIRSTVHQVLIIINVHLTAHQTIHLGLCTALTSMGLVLISNSMCIVGRAVDRTHGLIDELQATNK